MPGTTRKPSETAGGTEETGLVSESPVKAPGAPEAPVVPDGQPGWLVNALSDLHDRLVKLGG